MRIDTAVEIDAPVERVWSVLTDYARYGDWNPYLVAVEGRAEAGTTVVVDARPAEGGAAGLRYPVDVVEVEAPHLMRWMGGLADRTQFEGDHRWELRPAAAGRTHLRHWEELAGTLAAQIMGDGSAAAADFDRFNQALKARAERSGVSGR
jgi:hypothetical protein